MDLTCKNACKSGRFTSIAKRLSHVVCKTFSSALLFKQWTFSYFFLLFICRGCIRPRTAGLGVGNEGYEVNRKTQEYRQLVRSLYTRRYVSPDCSDLWFPIGRSSTVAFLQEMLLITSHAISCINFCRGLFILCSITPAISSTTKYICIWEL